MAFRTGLTKTEKRTRRILIAALVVFGLTALGWAAMRFLTPTASGSINRAAATTLSTEEKIDSYQNKLSEMPDNPYFLAQLGLAYLQGVRETADASLYLQAEAAFQAALSHDPEQVDALVGQGILALARHDFVAALEWAEKARAVNPYRSDVLGIVVDAQVELGRYEQAVVSAQEMVDMKPGLASYSRVSYIRELHGDVPGAIEAMQAAVEAGLPGAEGTLWAMYQLGALHFNAGEWDQAAAVYQKALQFQPNYPYAQAGLAAVQAAEGDYQTAIGIMEPLAKRLPLPQFVIQLGDLYWKTGQTEKAQQQYDLVGAIQQLNAESGMNVDLELALFEADYGEPAAALSQAQAAYEARPGIHGADVLGWALYKNGRYQEAYQYSQEALRLGVQDATLYFHAGMIALELGKTAEGQAYIDKALSINPGFSLRYLEMLEERK